MFNQESPLILAILSPKGGTGKTTFAAGLARTLASKNLRVLLVDCDTCSCSLQHSLHLDFPAPDHDFSDWNEISHLPQKTISPRTTKIANLDLTPFSANDVKRAFTELRNANYDYIIVDTLPGANITNLQIADEADMPIILSTPEPAPIFAVTNWLRFAIETHLAPTPLANALKLHPNWEYADVCDNLSDPLLSEFKSATNQKTHFFVLNHRRDGSEITQSAALCHAWSRYLGADIRFLGSLHFEERRWFFERRFSLEDPFTQDDAMQTELAKIADLVIAQAFPPRPCIAALNPLQNARDFLTVEPDEEPRHAYRRLYEGYRRENGLLSFALPQDLIRKIMTQLEAAWLHIHNGLSSNPVEQPPKSEPKEDPLANSNLPGATRRLSGTFSTLANNYNPNQCDDNAGAWLRAARNNTGTSLSALALKTRISPRILDAIERLDIERIPASHLQAYLFEIAKALDLPLNELRFKFGFK